MLAPIGIGQSMLICGPKDTGKSTLANQVVEYALAGRQVDKVVHFQSSSAPPADPTLQRVGALMQLVRAPRRCQQLLLSLLPTSPLSSKPLLWPRKSGTEASTHS